MRLTGAIAYETREPTPEGLGAVSSERPARAVTVAAVDAEGTVLGTVLTGQDGSFSIEAPLGARLVVRAESGPLAVTRDAAGAVVHAAPIPTGARFVARDDESALAGALHLLDTLQRGVEAVRRWTGRELPPLYAYWDRGVTSDWSYYQGERPEGSGRYCIELLGGQPGARTTSDTDEHDEAIVLHELGHFVMDRLGRDSSIGGRHPRGSLLDPGIAWEEGRATWFAAAVRGEPVYDDSIGLAPMGSLRVADRLESPAPPRGIGSETSVAGVLWDLADGGELPDADGDGVALGPAALLGAMVAMGGQDGVYGSLPTFLRFLVDQGALPGPELASMLARTGEPADLLPGPGVVPWPRELVLGRPVGGKIDGLSQPAPSGGTNLPLTGLDANHAFGVRAMQPGLLSLSLSISGSGGASDHTDLDLELRSLDAELLGASRGTGPQEAVARRVEPGFYVVYVRDGGAGNRADYLVTATLGALR